MLQRIPLHTFTFGSKKNMQVETVSNQQVETKSDQKLDIGFFIVIINSMQVSKLSNNTLTSRTYAKVVYSIPENQLDEKEIGECQLYNEKNSKLIEEKMEEYDNENSKLIEENMEKSVVYSIPENQLNDDEIKECQKYNKGNFKLIEEKMKEYDNANSKLIGENMEKSNNNIDEGITST